MHAAHDRGHGRDETRTLQVLPVSDGLFPHAAQAFLIERAVRDPHDGQLRSAAAALGITSRTRERGGTPETIAAAARGHWDIEALHHVRDTTMREDAQRLRSGSSAQVMAVVRNTASRRSSAGRIHRHRAWPALGRTKPRQAHRRPSSQITRMTTALSRALAPYALAATGIPANASSAMASASLRAFTASPALSWPPRGSTGQGR